MVKRTAYAWLIAIVGLLIYEGYTLLNAAQGDTLSEAVWAAADRPLLPFLVGILCGHFFWQRKGKNENRP